MDGRGFAVQMTVPVKASTCGILPYVVLDSIRSAALLMPNFPNVDGIPITMANAIRSVLLAILRLDPTYNTVLTTLTTTNLLVVQLKLLV